MVWLSTHVGKIGVVGVDFGRCVEDGSGMLSRMLFGWCCMIDWRLRTGILGWEMIWR